MILEADHTCTGEAVFGSMRPLAAVLASLPVVGPGFELKDLVAVEPVLYVAVVEHDA